MPEQNTIVRGPRRSRHIFHWIITAAFFALFLTGLIIFTPPLGHLAAGGWTRLVHRIAVVILVTTPVIYVLTNRKAARQWLKETLFWHRKANQPPAILRTWRRFHRTLVIIGYVLFSLTGMTMWFLKEIAPTSLLQWSLYIHGVIFILAGVVLLYHVFFEFDWWWWKRKNCRQCTHFSCIEVCPTKAMIRTPDGTVEFHRNRCDNCGICMQHCRLYIW